MQPGRGPFLQPSVWPIEHAKVNHDVVIIILLVYWYLRAIIMSHHVRSFHWRIIFIAHLTSLRCLCWFRFSGFWIYIYIFSLGIGCVCVSGCVMCFLYFLCRSVWAVVCTAVSAAASYWERRWPLFSTRYVWGEEATVIGQGECVCVCVCSVRH